MAIKAEQISIKVVQYTPDENDVVQCPAPTPYQPRRKARELFRQFYLGKTLS
jgi:hypothetical protein